MTIVEFLGARISEDEAAAQAAVGNDGPPTWLQDNADGVYAARPDVDWDELCQSHTYGVPNECEFNPTACGVSVVDDSVLEHARAEHIARHDPARVLAECEAKRRIVEYCSYELGDEYERFPVLDLLAQPYADHPDFDPAWGK